MYGVHSFLDLGIRGESTDKDHKDWIDIADIWEPSGGDKPAFSIVIGPALGPRLRQLVANKTTFPQVQLDVVSGPNAAAHYTLWQAQLAGGSSTTGGYMFTLQYGTKACKGTHIPELTASSIRQKPDGTAAG